MVSMHKNNTVKKLTARITSVNSSRNRYVVAAIILTTLLIVSVFSIGMSYLKSSEIQQLRMMGSMAHIALTNPTNEQVDKLRTLSYLKTIGLQHNAGLIESTPQMGNMTLSLHWYDKTEWEKLRLPAVTDMVGTYPENYNEIMVPLWVLHNMGIDDPQIGMELTLCYFPGDDRSIAREETFILSGYCTEYSYIRSGNVGSLYVSEDFAKRSGNSVEKNGAASVVYKDSQHIDTYNKRLTADLSLTENQKIKIVPMYEISQSVSSTTQIAFTAVIFFLMFTGYLLIYNVFYISVSRDTRFYGLLKTIGTTPIQLKKIVRGQALTLALTGIPIGLIIGALLSLIVVPLALSMFDLKTGTEVSFHPLIFLGAAFFALLTTCMGAEKSASIAAKISPIEALRFTGTRIPKNGRHSPYYNKPPRANLGNLHHMAWRNIFRNKNRALVVFLSLFLGITSFLSITTLITSMDTDNYIASYVKNDFILENNTLDIIGTSSGNAPKQKFDTSFLEQLKKIDGITDLRTTTMERMTMQYDPAKFSAHMDWFCKKFDVKEQLTDKQIQDNFSGFIIGIDNRYVEEFNKDSNSPIDVEAFKRGEIALIGTDDPEIYSHVDKIQVSIPVSGATLSLSLGGFVPFGFQYAGGCMAPNIYVSEDALANWVTDPKIYKINMNVENNMEEQALEKIKSSTDGDYDISRTSRLEQQESMSEVKLLLYILGGGIAIILALIGILNFINVMATSVMTRKFELAMLESVGMTKKQIKHMLLFEGLGYAGVITLLTSSFGNLITYGFFLLFKQQADYAVFTFPFIPLLITTALVCMVCAITPNAAYQSINRSTIVERLRETD